MKKDFHIHPTVTADAARFDGFVKTALSRGIEELCVTDHMPLSISDAKDRIKSGEVGKYCRTVRELAKRCEGIISVKCGIEIDWHPSVSGEAEAVISEGDFDYVLGSTHMHLFSKGLLGEEHTAEEFAEAALQNTLSAVNSGFFTAVSHFDMFRWVFTLPDRFTLRDYGYSWKNHEKTVREILDAIKEKDMFLEINSHLALVSSDISFTYPEREITELALQKGLKFSFGSDAHKENEVGAMYDVLKKHPVYGRALEIWEGEKL